METAELTVQLPRQDLEFAKDYAREHRITVSELIDRYLRRLRLRIAEIRPETRGSHGDAWQDLFQLGDALATEDSPETETLTAAVLSMRR